MNLIFVAGKDPTLEIGGGHSVYVRAHARAAVSRGFRPEIFCVSDRGGVVETEYGVVFRERSLLPLRVIPGMGSPDYLALSPVHVRQLSRSIEKRLGGARGRTLLHGFGVWAASGLAAARRGSRRARIPVLASLYTRNEEESRAKMAGLSRLPGSGRRTLHWWNERFWVRLFVDRLERRVLFGADLILVNYRRLLRSMEALPGTAPCRRITYASESAFEDEAREVPPVPLPPGNAPLVLSVSRHDPRKGVDILLRALAELRRSGLAFRACLLGGGLLLEAHRRLASDLGLGDEVRITGFVQDPRPYFSAAEIFVLPSLQEGSGSLSLLEALQHGKAIVATRCDGVPEDVDDGESALLVEREDVAGLAGAIRSLLADARLRTMLGRAARRRFEERFSAPVFSKALSEVYEAALAGRLAKDA